MTYEQMTNCHLSYNVKRQYTVASIEAVLPEQVL